MGCPLAWLLNLRRLHPPNAVFDEGILLLLGGVLRASAQGQALSCARSSTRAAYLCIAWCRRLLNCEVPNYGGRPDLGAALSAVVVELLFVSLDRLTTTIS